MVASQLRTNAVSDPRVISAMDRVPREDFLPADVRTLAYRDTAVPIGGGRSINLPVATGRLLDAAALRAGERVLLIGAASGYAAAVLLDLGCKVIAVEVDPALIARARAAIGGGVEFVEAPLSAGYSAGAPYDVIMIDGAVAAVPTALVDQLRPGGRLVSGVVDRGVTRLAAGSRTVGGFAIVAFADIACVALPGFEPVKTFIF